MFFEREKVYTFENIWQAWPFGEWRYQAIENGANSFVQKVETAAGDYVLRVITNQVELPRLAYEVSLVRQLANMDLSFSVPVNVPTRTGHSVVQIQTERGIEPAVLLPFIGGIRSERTNPEHCRVAGAGLAELTLALAQLPPDLGDPTLKPLTPYEDLTRVHPLVPDPLTALDSLSVEPALKRRFNEILTALLDDTPRVYQKLPRQIIHSDYIRANLLFEGNRLNGVLDFEFACPDVRAMDIAILISHWPFGYLGTGEEWPLIEGFAAGYKERIKLTTNELEAFPTLMNLRNVACVLHFIGRLRQGLDEPELALSWVQDTPKVDDWVEHNFEKIISFF